MGLTFALGLSSKFLHLPLAVIGVSLLRSPFALALSVLTGILAALNAPPAVAQSDDRDIDVRHQRDTTMKT